MLHSSGRHVVFGVGGWNNQLIPCHAEPGPLLLCGKRSDVSLTGIVRAQHSECLDQEFARAAVNLFLPIAAERTPTVVMRSRIGSNPFGLGLGVGFSLGSLSFFGLGVGFGLGSFGFFFFLGRRSVV